MSENNNFVSTYEILEDYHPNNKIKTIEIKYGSGYYYKIEEDNIIYLTEKFAQELRNVEKYVHITHGEQAAWKIIKIFYNDSNEPERYTIQSFNDWTITIPYHQENVIDNYYTFEEHEKMINEEFGSFEEGQITYCDENDF